MWCKICSIILLLVSSIQAFEEYQFTNIRNKSNEGEPCEWEGKNGTCINFWHCLTNAIDAAYGIHPLVCKHENGEVFSCCTSCFVVSNISSSYIVPKFGMWLQRTGKKSTDKCMEYMNLNWSYPCYERFTAGEVEKDYDDEKKCYGFSNSGWLGAGGEDASREEFPHMALLGFGESEWTADWVCGGSIISDKFIITAAHCRSSPLFGEVKYAALGILKRSDPRELWNVYEVDRFIPHPDYRPPSKYHDIALIRTKKQITFSNAVLPACLPRDDSNTEKGVATGWGALGHRQKLADVLQKLEVSRFNKANCSVHYKPHRHFRSGYNHTTQMCYGDIYIGRDTCEGDSGGPLLADGSCPPVVMGVTSTGHPCGFPGGAGLYTRVHHYVPWIENIVWPGEVKYVTLGILKRSDPRELWNVYEVDRFIPHPDYRPPSKYHDIALIRTMKRIVFSNAVLPACLPGDDNNTYIGVATGWGALGYRQTIADVLQKMRLSRFDKENCSLLYRPHRHFRSGYNHTTQMCYGDRSSNRDTCEGDSGGPLLAYNSCPPVVMGVTSSGHRCGFTGGAGLYTRVGYYVPWIENIVWP